MKTSLKIIIGTGIFLLASTVFAYDVTCSTKGVNSAPFASSGLFSFNSLATAQTGTVELETALTAAGKKLLPGDKVECIIRDPATNKPLGYMYFTVVSGVSRITAAAGLFVTPDPKTIDVLWV